MMRATLAERDIDQRRRALADGGNGCRQIRKWRA